jgi:hypothetical protein
MVKKVDYTIDDLLPIGIYCKGVHGFYVKTDAKWKTFQELSGMPRPGQVP